LESWIDLKRSAFISNVFTFIGVILAGAGLLTLALAAFNIYVSEYDCPRGGSPHPVQGCGYVLHLALYVWGDLSLLVYGFAALALGVASIVVARDVNSSIEANRDHLC
jgi:uncharacterized membrane protein HdeD (DUF308 family)